MSLGFKIIVACVMALIVLMVSYVVKKNRKLAKEERERQERNLKMLHAQYDEHLERYAAGIDTVSDMLPFESGYCAWTDLQNKLNEIKSLVPTVNIPKSYPDGNPRDAQYKTIMDFVVHAEALRSKHNDAFVEHEMQRCTDYFKQVLNHPLDDQQIDAIVHRPAF